MIPHDLYVYVTTHGITQPQQVTNTQTRQIE